MLPPPLLLLGSLPESDAPTVLNPRDYFEIFWWRAPIGPTSAEAPASWLRLVTFNLAYPADYSGQQGVVVRFTREYLEEDDKEYALDVVKLFIGGGEPPVLALAAAADADLRALCAVLAREYQLPAPSFLILKALLKALLLNLLRLQHQPLMPQDVQGKRVYEFVLLMNAHYRTHTEVAFYADRLGLTAKRLNQVLVEKLRKTATQILHERLLLEARYELTTQTRTIKEIAFYLGFEEPSYFARFFKKHTGLSPSDFQRLEAPLKLAALPTTASETTG